MIEPCEDSKGLGTKTRQRLRKKHPWIEFSESFIQNAITRMRLDSERAQKFVNTLETMKENVQVELLHISLHQITNVLEGTVCSYVGSQGVVSRCKKVFGALITTVQSSCID